jgi:hypothetical protein
MVPCIGSIVSNIIGKIYIDKNSIITGNKHIYKFIGSRIMVFASYFNNDRYLLIINYPLAALSLNMGYTANLKRAAARINRYRHPVIVIAISYSPVTAEVIKWLAEWDGEIISNHSYFPSITFKLNRIDGMVNRNMYPSNKPSIELKSLLLNERTKPIAAWAAPDIATNSKSAA